MNIGRGTESTCPHPDIPMIMEVADAAGGLPNLRGAAIGDGSH